MRKQLLLLVLIGLITLPTFAQTTAKEWADKAWNSKETSEKIRCYNEAIKLDQKQAFIYHDRGNALYTAERYQDALEDYDKAFLLSSQAFLLSSGASHFYYDRANVKKQLGRNRDAVTDYNNTVLLNPKYTDAYIGRGIINNALERYEKALSDFNDAIRLDSSNAKAYVGRGRSEYFIGDYQKALEDYSKARLLDPNQDDVYYMDEGKALKSLGRNQDALIDFEKALQVNPHNTQAYLEKGETEKILGKFQEAFTDYNAGIHLDSTIAEAFNGRGLLNRFFGYDQKAITDYDKAISINQKFAEAYNNRGNAKYGLGRWEEANTDFDQAARLDSKYIHKEKKENLTNLARYTYTMQQNPTSDVACALGNTNYNLNRYWDALLSYEMAIRLNPQSIKAFIGRATTLQELGRYQEAIAASEEAIRLDSKFASAYAIRAKAKQSLGVNQEALADFDKAITLDANKADPYVGRGTIKNLLTSYQEALTDFDKAIALDSMMSNAYLRKGQTLVKLGRYSEALTYFQKGEKLDPRLGYHRADKLIALQKVYKQPIIISNNLPPTPASNTVATATSHASSGSVAPEKTDYKTDAPTLVAVSNSSPPSSITVNATPQKNLAREAPVAKGEQSTPTSSPGRDLSQPEPGLVSTTPPSVKTPTKRYALLIGNGTYASGNSLGPQPLNDSQDMATRLQSLGFTVERYENLNRKGINDRVYDFARKVKDADVALFFYAGHGLMQDGHNYLIPTDAELTDPDRAADEANSVDRIIQQIQGSGVRFCFAMLDACRSQPFRSWSRDNGQSRAFVPINVPSSVRTSTYLMLATQPGEVALNGDGRNGFFTAGLLKALQQGASIERVKLNTLREVLTNTQNRQRPQAIDDMLEDFQF